VSHGNARLTFHGRKLIVERHRAGWPQAHIAAAMGISRKCVRTWITRYDAEGEAGLVDRSSRPHSSPRRTAAAVEDRIVELRRRERRGPAWLAPSSACRPAPSPGSGPAAGSPGCASWTR
jgi:leucine-zipper of insertion element IS481